MGIFLIHPFQAPKEYASTPGNQLHTSGSQRLRERGYICHVSSFHEQHTTNSLTIPDIMRLTSGMRQPFQNAGTSAINYKRSWTLKPRVFQLSRLQRFNILPKYCIISFYRISCLLVKLEQFKCFALQPVDSIQSPFVQSIPFIFPLGFLYCWLLHPTSILLLKGGDVWERPCTS